jgi:hypothetical protein
MADIKMALGLDSKGFERGLASAGRSLGSFAAKVGVAVGATAGLSKAIQAGRTVEDLRVRLDFLAGSAENGARTLEMATKAAQDMPFALEDISAGLSSIVPISDTFGALETNLQAVADVAAISGLSFEQTAQQFQRAFAGGAGAADLFRDRGILAMAGFESGVSYSVEQTQKKLLEFAAANEGAADALNQTLTGALSQVEDRLFKVNAAFGAAFNPQLTALLTAVIDAFDAGSGSINEMARSLADNLYNALEQVIIGSAALLDMIMPVFSFVTDGINNLFTFFNKLPPTLKALGLFGFMMLGGKGKLIVVAISAAYETIIGLANSALQVIESMANKAIMGINAVIEYVNTIPGVNLTLFNEVDFGEVTPEGVKNKLDEILSIFEDNTEIATIGPIERKITDILSAARAQIEELKAEANAAATAGEGGPPESPSDPLGTPDNEEETSWGKFTSGWGSATEAFKKNVEDMTQFGEQLFNKMANGFSDAILNFVETGKLSFKDLFKTLMTELIKMQANKLFLTLFGGPGGGAIGSFFSGLFKAEGGPVSANRPYIVGEQGPELFMPSSAGTIVPNGEFGMGGGGTTVVNYNISAVDAMSFKQMVAQDPEFIYSVTRAGQRRLPA